LYDSSKNGIDSGVKKEYVSSLIIIVGLLSQLPKQQTGNKVNLLSLVVCPIFIFK